MMGLRGIGVLLAVVLGLLAVLYFTDQKPKVDKVAETAVLEGRSLNDCAHMRWQFHERTPIEVGRGPDGRFQLQEPIVDDASMGHMHQIVTAWDSARMRATPLQDDEQGQKQAGLLPPEMVFTVDFADKTSLTIEVGAPGPLGTTRFLHCHGKIWEGIEGSEGLIESMRGNPDDLRERVVFRNAFVQAGATEVRVDQQLDSGKRETIHVKREKDGWHLLEPVKGRADPGAVQGFVTAVFSLTVTDFPGGAPRLPERPPLIEVMVKGAYGEENLKLWDQHKELFGMLPGRNNLWFTSDSLQYAQIFENSVERLRARILVPMGETAFAELVDLVADPGQGRGDRVRLSRESPSADWRLVEPVSFAAAPTPCNEAVQAVQTLVAMEFVDDKDGKRPRAEDPRYGLQAGHFAIAVRGVRDQTVTTLWFGSDAQRGNDAFVYTCRADEPDTVVLVQKPQVTTLRRSWLDYCSLLVLKQGAGVDRIDLVHKDGKKRTFQIEADHWQLVGAAGDRREVGELVENDLKDLHGTKAVDARPPEFEQPDWTLELMRKTGDRLGLLKFWDRGADQPIVVMAGQDRSPVAFELRLQTTKELRALWQ